MGASDPAIMNPLRTLGVPPLNWRMMGPITETIAAANALLAHGRSASNKRSYAVVDYTALSVVALLGRSTSHVSGLNSQPN